MTSNRIKTVLALAGLAVTGVAFNAAAEDIESKPGSKPSNATEPLKVYILAGQSNMQGHARVETFDYIGDDPATAPLLEEMRGSDGKMTKAQQQAHLEHYRAELITPAEEALWQRGASNGGYHYLGSTRTMAQIGKAFAAAMLEMQPETKKAAAAKKARFDPVIKNIEGWTVHVDPKLLEGEHAKEGARALKMLANHLQRIAILMPEERLKEMRKLGIWIEHDHPDINVEPGPYHPDVEWLTERGYDARLAKKVHVTRAASLLERHHMVKHPAVILHELAHSYHDQVLDFDEPRIKAAYDKAMKAGLYDKVLLYTGKKVRAYAASNHMEYFAEGTEAYFYRNDFYPFVRAELKLHDPVLHDLLEEIWGPLE